MDKFEKINKINELKKQLSSELVKEEKDLVMIKSLKNKIMALGLTLTKADFTR